jgi:hypothetical protein
MNFQGNKPPDKIKDSFIKHGLRFLSGPIGIAGGAVLDYAKEKIAGNIRPQGYQNPLERVAEAIVKPEAGSFNKMTEYLEQPYLRERQDFLGLMMKGEQQNNTLPISTTRPTNSKNEEAVYYNSPETENRIKEQLKDPKFLEQFSPSDKGIYSAPPSYNNKSSEGNVLGKYTMNLGEDDKGKYVSYYDKWDLDPYKGKNSALDMVSTIAQKAAGIKPAEAYGRVYYGSKK